MLRGYETGVWHSTRNNPRKEMQYQGLFGLIVADRRFWAIVNVFQDTRIGKEGALDVLVIILPVLGFSLWIF